MSIYTDRCQHCGQYKSYIGYEEDYENYHYDVGEPLTALQQIILDSRLSRMGSTYYDEAGFTCKEALEHNMNNVDELIATLKEHKALV